MLIQIICEICVIKKLDSPPAEKVTSTSKTSYIYSNGQLVAKLQEEPVGTPVKLYYYHNDHLGSPRAITDKDGKGVESYFYYPFGGGGPVGGPSFTGKELDATGLFYFGARYYDPALGRFISPDPILEKIPPQKALREPQRLNPYAYGGNNPLKNVEIDGEWFVLALGYLDTGADIAFTSADVASFIQGPSWGKAGDVGIDIGCMLIPFASVGVVKGVKYLSKADKVVDAAKGINRIETTVDATKAINKPDQLHHFLSNKHSSYTKLFENITQKYGLDINKMWNKELMPQLGRHPEAYHEYMLKQLYQIDKVAKGDVNIFMKEFNARKDYIIKHPELLDKAGW